ncbi:thrombomodulin-like [Epinephelus lanceolatus]|uniref:thrombomodulin-like n=1 Tax=Epinephelus lanceolatus TaxID=310571 RepID=UPI0014450E4D|nr:thrombomodulin-like [Epinephelus lanceolatus]
MIPPTQALLIGAVFLCALEETVQSHLGHCAENQCFALFQDPEDHAGAQKHCKDSGGQLLKYSFGDFVKILKSPVSGHFWLDASAEEAAAGLRDCPSIFVSMGQDPTVLWKPCRDTMDGFLCQYTFDEPCSGLLTSEGAQVNYTSHWDFDLYGSEAFPPGTIAVEKKVDGKYPDSKHMCFSSVWLQAPWNCEVFRGGCEHICASPSPQTHTCLCPAGTTLHPNNFACTRGPCEENPCTGEDEECQITEGGFSCRCKDGFVKEDGVCVNVSICVKCEHMKCNKSNGVYECGCREGFRVSPHNPTKCEVICTERDCPGLCIQSHPDNYQCFCPDGYIQDIVGTKPLCTDINECESDSCDFKCENIFGSYRCLCDEGFKLDHDGHKCIPMEEEEEDGSGFTHSDPTPASAYPAVVPSYIKTGSVLGITVFMALCAALLFFLIRNTVKRCGKFELTSFKHPDIDIYYLQQVTTETYKRLSFDKSKNDP